MHSKLKIKTSSNNLFKVNNGNSRTMCEIYLKVNNKDNGSGVFIVNFEQISPKDLVFPLLTFDK